jgi:hypothetical protein
MQDTNPRVPLDGDGAFEAPMDGGLPETHLIDHARPSMLSRLLGVGMLVVLAILVVAGGVGYYLQTQIQKQLVAVHSFHELVALHDEVAKADTEALDSEAWRVRAAGFLKDLDRIAKPLRASRSGTAERDVMRMGTCLKDMIQARGLPRPSTLPVAAPTPYETAQKRFSDSARAAAKKMGLK